MATYVIYSDSADGYVYSQAAFSAYSTARSGGGTLTADSSNDYVVVGQVQIPGALADYYCYEGFISFDTSGIGANPTAAVLDMYGAFDWSGVNFTVNARAYDWGASVTTADYIAGASLSANALRATFATSGFTTSGYNTFTSEGTFKDNLTNPVRLVLSSSRLESGTTPGSASTAGDANDERVYFFSSNKTGISNDPTLTVTADALPAGPAPSRRRPSGLYPR